MTQASSADVKPADIDLGLVERVEKGEAGVRVWYRNGDREFVDGERGFEIYQRWLEIKVEAQNDSLT